LWIVETKVEACYTVQIVNPAEFELNEKSI
jgi:hypothetical protein